MFDKIPKGFERPRDTVRCNCLANSNNISNNNIIGNNNNNIGNNNNINSNNIGNNNNIIGNSNNSNNIGNSNVGPFDDESETCVRRKPFRTNLIFTTDITRKVTEMNKKEIR